MFPESMAFVLVRPSEAGNVGAAARIMKNFGFTDLRLVLPAVDFLEQEDKWMAVGAYDLITRARVFDNLSEALADVSFAVGTTSARFRAVEPLEFTEVCSESRTIAQQNNVAWVFGNERNGLTFDELERCHSTTCVATSAEFSVLNVAQAVAIVAYECSRGTRNVVDKQKPMPKGQDEDQLFGKVDTLLRRIRFTRDFNHGLVIKELRSAYQKIRATNREFGLLNGIVLRLLDRIAPNSPDENSSGCASEAPPAVNKSD